MSNITRCKDPRKKSTTGERTVDNSNNLTDSESAKCPNCHVIFKDLKSLLDDHRCLPFTCNICHSSFLFDFALKMHKCKLNNTEENVESDKDICNLCNENFASSDLMMNHKQFCSGINDKELKSKQKKNQKLDHEGKDENSEIIERCNSHESLADCNSSTIQFSEPLPSTSSNSYPEHTLDTYIPVIQLTRSDVDIANSSKVKVNTPVEDTQEFKRRKYKSQSKRTSLSLENTNDVCSSDNRNSLSTNKKTSCESSLSLCSISAKRKNNCTDSNTSSPKLPCLKSISRENQIRKEKTELSATEKDKSKDADNEDSIKLESLLNTISGSDSAILLKVTTSTSNSYKCVKCEKIFRNIRTGAAHFSSCRISRNRKRPVSLKDIQWLCTFCYFHCQNSSDLFHHHRSCFKSVDKFGSGDDTSIIECIKNYRDRCANICSKCGYTCISILNFKNHSCEERLKKMKTCVVNLEVTDVDKWLSKQTNEKSCQNKKVHNTSCTETNTGATNDFSASFTPFFAPWLLNPTPQSYDCTTSDAVSKVLNLCEAIQQHNVPNIFKSSTDVSVLPKELLISSIIEILTKNDELLNDFDMQKFVEEVVGVLLSKNTDFAKLISNFKCRCNPQRKPNEDGELKPCINCLNTVIMNYCSSQPSDISLKKEVVETTENMDICIDSSGDANTLNMNSDFDDTNIQSTSNQTNWVDVKSAKDITGASSELSPEQNIPVLEKRKSISSTNSQNVAPNLLSSPWHQYFTPPDTPSSGRAQSPCSSSLNSLSSNLQQPEYDPLNKPSTSGLQTGFAKPRIPEPEEPKVNPSHNSRAEQEAYTSSLNELLEWSALDDDAKQAIENLLQEKPLSPFVLDINIDSDAENFSEEEEDASNKGNSSNIFLQTLSELLKTDKDDKTFVFGSTNVTFVRNTDKLKSCYGLASISYENDQPEVEEFICLMCGDIIKSKFIIKHLLKTHEMKDEIKLMLP